MEASAPPEEFEEDVQNQTPSTQLASFAQHANLVASAPVLDEDDEDLVDAVRTSGRTGQTSRRVSEVLPVYRR